MYIKGWGGRSLYAGQLRELPIPPGRPENPDLRSRLHPKGLEAGLINAGVREQQVEAAQTGLPSRCLTARSLEWKSTRQIGQCVVTRCHRTSRFRPCFLKAWAADSFQSTKSRAGEQLLLLDCRARACFFADAGIRWGPRHPTPKCDESFCTPPPLDGDSV